jgi:hypothetical protein
MATPTTTGVLVRHDDPLDVRERAAIAGFLAGYTDRTRVSYTTDLRLFTIWCDEVGVGLLDVKLRITNLWDWIATSSTGSSCRPVSARHALTR